MKNQLNKESVKNLSLEKACPVCQVGNIKSFLEILDVPVHIGLLWSSKDSARQCPKGTINLGFCHACGFITNLSFEPSLLDYTQAYDNSLDFSPHFRDYAHSLALRLIERHNLFNKDLIEIGCGNGNFLRLLCELGGNRGVGFDPSYEPTRNDNSPSKQITFIKDFFSEHYCDIKVDFICCRNVLEHIYNPIEFLTMLRNIIGERSSISLYFEVPSMLFALRDLSIWDIIYEHCSYFSHESLPRVFTTCGFSVCDLYETFGSECLAIEALPRERGTGTPLKEDSSVLTHEIINFANRYNKKLEFWQEQLEGFKKSMQRVVVWGAGARGVSFFNMLKPQDLIEYAVDINPNKQNKFIAGTGQQIVSPEFLLKYRPDIVIVMNQIYKNEIQQTLNELGLEPIFYCA
jgi:SAM-dependent methyltransferase